MPRLADVGTFLFYADANVSKENIERVSKMKAIDVITEILTYKLSKSGQQNRLYLLNGRTGSGKSTYFLQELYRRFIVKAKCGIICTEPQVVLTESNARDIINYNSGWELGKELGIRSSRMHIKGDRESITFCTTQILNDLLMHIISKNNGDLAKREFRKMKFIIIDEVHTLDIPMISTLKVLRDLINTYGNMPEFPLIIFSSATMDMLALSQYFNMNMKDPFMCGIVSGDPNFPIDESYLSNDAVVKFNELEKTKNNVNTSYDIIGLYFCKKIYPLMCKDTSKSRDALIFVPGALGIQTTSNMIKASINDLPVFNIVKGCTLKSVMHWRSQNRGKLRLLIVGFASGYSEASDTILANSEDFDKESLENEMKVIIATTALETGKTLYRLKYVMDMGLQTAPNNVPLSYDTTKTVEYFRQIPENKNQMIQRKGRVGRVASGVVVHFYTQDVEDGLQTGAVPQTIDNYCLSEVIIKSMLIRKLWNVYDIGNENDYLYPTSTDIIAMSAQDLIRSGYLTIHGVLSRLYHKSLDVNKQRIYAKYMYEVLGYNLFTTALFTVTSIKDIPNTFDVKHFKPKSSMDITGA